MGKIVRSKIKSWRIGEYIRQFSIVTAGVVVTFMGSNVIDNMSTDKEIKSTMVLMINELENNKSDLAAVVDKYQSHKRMATYLIDNDFDVRAMNVDTLKKYQSFISTLSRFDYSSDALDVLKGSSLMSKIDDKELLLNVIEVYQAFASIQKTMNEYYDLKESIIVPAVLLADNHLRGDVYESYEVILSRVEMKNFCIITTGFFL